MLTEIMDRRSQPNIILGRQELHGAIWGKTTEDAWRLYLGIPQAHNTFGISDYQPSKHKEVKYYFKINDFFEKLFQHYPYSSLPRSDTLRMYVLGIGAKRHKIKKDQIAGIMGDYTMSIGEDEKGSYVSYYDKWDLDQIPIEKNGFVGKPYEIYDRLYYDPETFEPKTPPAPLI
jgi:hypothetical protein